MKESYRENLASYSGLEPYAVDGNIEGVASARGTSDSLPCPGHKAGPSASHVDCTACTIKLTLGCPQGQHAQVHRFVASRQRRLFNRSLLQFEEDGGSRSRWGYLDSIDHEWLVEFFLEHRIGDRRILRLIRKWLRAGVSEEGE